MSEDIEKQAATGNGVPGPAPPANRGWFRPGDGRINREGRPRGSKAAAPEGADPAGCAPRTDRLKVVRLRERDLAWRLTRQNAPWMTNLPADVRIVGCRVDAARRGVVLTIWSKSFPRVARGTRIPEFVPAFNGLRWRRGDGP
jgi:hypothetical protein